jgi:hypothetical protein
MGTSQGDFVKYPKTPHLFGSTGTTDDAHLSARQSMEFLANESLLIEEKIDGTNVGIHFSDEGKLILQCRGHLITEGMHPQYDLFKQWAAAKQYTFAEQLQNRFILFGEWVYARHTIHYRKLPHYFFVFDIYDKHEQVFLSHERRSDMLSTTAIPTVPQLTSGPVKTTQLEKLMGASKFSGQFENSSASHPDQLMEGLYLRIEDGGIVTGRAKFVRRKFVDQMKQNDEWRHKAIVPNGLAEGADIWS